jgi:YidC/Oxa1 family membrane protein insertase
MQLWSLWLEGIRGTLHVLSGDFGLGIGLGIVALTLFTRLGLLPLTWSIGYRGAIRQKRMARLQPQLKLLKDDFGHDPKAYGAKLQKLYAEHGLSMADGRSLLGLIAQAPILLGMYQVFRDSANAGRFLWIKDLARPDLRIALLVGATSAILMAANPDLPEQLRLLLIAVPAIIAVMMALKLCSALAVYLAVSNGFSAVQTYWLHSMVARRVRSGALVI